MNIGCLILGALCVSYMLSDDKEDFSILDEQDFSIRDSRIHGKGLYTTKQINKGDDIFLAVDISKLDIITPKGKYVNHCNKPNTKLKKCKDGWMLTALHNILEYTELTADYNDTPYFIKKPDPKWKC